MNKLQLDIQNPNNRLFKQPGNPSIFISSCCTSSGESTDSHWKVFGNFAYEPSHLVLLHIEAGCSITCIAPTLCPPILALQEQLPVR